MNKYYYELTITPNKHYNLFLNLIINISNEAIEETNKTIIIRGEENLTDIKSGILEFTKKLNEQFDDNIICKTILEKKENIDWITTYQNSVKAIEVGEFYIHPNWANPSSTKKNILINPALAFGSGHHESTFTCLESISKYVKKNHSVIDIGCGSGILGIACSLLQAKVDLCDTDIIAVEDAVQNFSINNCTYNKAWEGSCNKTTTTYNVVIANIVADVLIIIKEDLKKITEINGIIILSGIIDKYKNKILNKFSDCKLIEEIQKNEWVTLILEVTKKGNNNG